MMQLELSRYIEGDLDDVADFIAQDNPVRAVTFIQDIRRKLSDIQRNPYIYQLRPDIGQDARMAVVGNYAILFRVIEGETVRIERVVYGGRNLPGVVDLL
ncbi:MULTISPECIES: type II toxin-antitoxin system RelE/ParE family toxin [unclassified Pseudomonas]|uniref:type II toxin-antitoxin system RelE/ParE family toxin n=1 Tax=unclassified Pseudomonas TaxID=196821 RepID=UPI000EABFA1D|nr:MULTISPECIES: type II toxin-antitoxin system RelE/ParE family toxin [unclassified Pseudomonas]MPQ68337.1 type II toxin-antitoxin system RelE/ParE family toxin [Pseudomonas sp. MWU12-2323]